MWFVDYVQYVLPLSIKLHFEDNISAIKSIQLTKLFYLYAYFAILLLVTLFKQFNPF